MQGVKVCQAVFLYANSVTRYTLKKVLSHLEAGVIVTPDRGRKGQAAWNTLDEAETAAAYTKLWRCVWPTTASWARRPQRAKSNLPALLHYTKNGAWAGPTGRGCNVIPVIHQSMVESVCRCCDNEAQGRCLLKCSDLQSQISRALNEEPAGLSTAASSLEAELQPAP